MRQDELKSELGLMFYQEIILSEIIEFIQTEHLLQKAYEISIELRHPIFDCLYLAVAQDNNGVVVTADKDFYNKTSKHELYKHLLRWVEEKP